MATTSSMTDTNDGFPFPFHIFLQFYVYIRSIVPVIPTIFLWLVSCGVPTYNGQIIDGRITSIARTCNYVTQHKFLCGGNMKALIISADNFEDTELLVPYYRLKEADMEVIVASFSRGVIKGKHGYEVAVYKTLDDVNPDDYGILILPGGAAPALVRKEPKALEIARSFFAHNKLVGAICHGPQILISADLLKGRHATCYSFVADELKEAGAVYEDREVVVDGNLVTSRQPADLPAFMREIMKQLGR